MLLSILPVLCKYAHHESGISALALLDCRTKVPLMLTWFLMSPLCVAAVYVLFNFQGNLLITYYIGCSSEPRSLECPA